MNSYDSYEFMPVLRASVLKSDEGIMHPPQRALGNTLQFVPARYR